MFKLTSVAGFMAGSRNPAANRQLATIQKHDISK
jgi:hypothetical protein